LALDLALGHRHCQWAKAVLTADDKEASMPITMSDCRIVELLTVRVPNADLERLRAEAPAKVRARGQTGYGRDHDDWEMIKLAGTAGRDWR
jgi:hypothetical protein